MLRQGHVANKAWQWASVDVLLLSCSAAMVRLIRLTHAANEPMQVRIAYNAHMVSI